MIRVNDTVRIVKPELFVRCGYETTVKSIGQQIAKSEAARLKEFFDYFHVKDYHEQQKIIHVLAYQKFRAMPKGGAHRRIFTHLHPDLQGTTARVLEIKYVKTGIYEPGWGSEDGYEPAHLHSERTHKLLRLNIIPIAYDDGAVVNDPFVLLSDYLDWIEAENCVKEGEEPPQSDEQLLGHLDWLKLA